MDILGLAPPYVDEAWRGGGGVGGTHTKSCTDSNYPVLKLFFNE